MKQRAVRLDLRKSDPLKDDGKSGFIKIKTFALRKILLRGREGMIQIGRK